MAKKEKLDKYSTSRMESREIGQAIEDMQTIAENRRRSHEKRWYDNNFFDDGHHFRFLSRSTGKIVDLSKRSSIFQPLRVIPKASRQIRGVVNLLMQGDFVPIVYPEKVLKDNYEQPGEYDQALQLSKTRASRIGHWVTEEWKSLDMFTKLAEMGLLTTKHSISYMQIWPDAVDEAIKTQVYDAFDIFLLGNLTSIYDSPFMIKGIPQQISRIKANENFDEEQVRKINPDNRFASSEIKEAYMNSRFSKIGNQDAAATVILKEAYIKEYLNSYNMERIRKQEDGEFILKNKKEGDPVVRQVFSAGNIWLRDVYTDLPDYPFVDFRMEPGPIYQVPLIERFKSANKSLDSVSSRIERYIHTMTTGTWLARKGEKVDINNIAGGQILRYENVPPVQGNMATIPAHVFNYMNFLNSVIEEQGVTTTTLGKLPKGVKANAAIESLKESELSNLVIASRQLKRTVKLIAEKMLDIADNYFISPQSVMMMEKGEPTYFDIMGQRGIDGRKKLGIKVPEDIIPIKKDYNIEIEVKSGLGYTQEGRRDAGMQLGEYLRALAAEGYIPPEAVKIYVEKLLETFQFGATAEFMKAMKDYKGGPMTDEQLMKMKIALAETIKDSGIKPSEADKAKESKQRVQESKIGMAEVVKDLQTGGQ